MYKDTESGLATNAGSKMAFKGNHHFLCKYEQPANGLLEEWQVKFNVIINHFRVRVEQVIGMIKRHSMLYKGSSAAPTSC